MRRKASSCAEKVNIRPPRPPLVKATHLPQELGMTLNSYMKEHRAVKIQCLLSEQEFSEMMAGEAVKGAIGAETASRDEHEQFVHCTYSASGEGPGGTLHSLQRGDMVCLLGAEQGGLFRRASSAVKRLRPRVVLPFSESSEIRRMLARLEKRVSAPLLHKRSVKRSMFGAMPRTSMEWDRNAHNREYQRADDVFRLAQESELMIDSLRVFTNEGEKLDVSVSRRGAVTVHAGDFKLVYDRMLEPIMSGALKRKKRFAHRSRSECRNKKPRPLLIEYKKNVFGDEGNRERFCKLIDSYTNCNYSIIHAGNPHIYISVLDKIDKSSLAIRSVGNDSLVIIPQIRTTESSLMRITAFLSSAFWEGQISDYKPHR